MKIYTFYTDVYLNIQHFTFLVKSLTFDLGQEATRYESQQNANK